MLINSTGWVPVPVQEFGNDASRWCLLTAMAAIGMKTQLREVATVGIKPVVLMILETVFLALLVLGADALVQLSRDDAAQLMEPLSCRVLAANPAGAEAREVHEVCYRRLGHPFAMIVKSCCRAGGARIQATVVAGTHGRLKRRRSLRSESAAWILDRLTEEGRRFVGDHPMPLSAAEVE